MWEELLKEIVIIKWGVVCIAVSLWGVTMYLLLKEIPEWWDSYKKRKKNFTVKQMRKDLAGAERPRTGTGRSQWD